MSDTTHTELRVAALPAELFIGGAEVRLIDPDDVETLPARNAEERRILRRTHETLSAVLALDWQEAENAFGGDDAALRLSDPTFPCLSEMPHELAAFLTHCAEARYPYRAISMATNYLDGEGMSLSPEGEVVRFDADRVGNAFLSEDRYRRILAFAPTPEEFKLVADQYFSRAADPAAAYFAEVPA